MLIVILHGAIPQKTSVFMNNAVKAARVKLQHINLGKSPVSTSCTQVPSRHSSLFCALVPSLSVCVNPVINFEPKDRFSWNLIRT